jgi:hypothetical protein
MQQHLIFSSRGLTDWFAMLAMTEDKNKNRQF